MNLPRKILTIITLTAACLCANAEYTLFAFTGKPAVTRNKRRLTVRTGLTLQGGDFVTLSKGEEIKIADREAGAVYVSTTAGTYRVSHIVDKAKGNAASKGKAIAKTILITPADKNRNTQKTRVGRTTRKINTSLQAQLPDTVMLYEWHGTD